MRILHIDTGMMMRGGQVQLMMLLRGLRRKGHEQCLACPVQSQLAQTARGEDFPVAPIDRAYWNAVPAIRRIAGDFEVVAAHDSRAQTTSYLATLGRKVVRVADRLVAFEPRNAFIHRLKYTKTCDIVIASSQAVKDTMVRNGVPATHIEVIRGGIDFPETLPLKTEARARMRAKWRLKEDDFVIGHLAAFTEEKGQLDALDALLALQPRYPNIKMILAGDGPLKHQAQLKAGQANAQLPGYIKAGADFYAGLDLFLANSTSEALGLAPLYAMAHEVAVIASNVGGLPEVVGPGGWLIPPSDPGALAAAIERAITNRVALTQAARRARDHARGFSAEVTIFRTEQLYRELLR